MTVFYVRYEVVVDADTEPEAELEAKSMIMVPHTLPTAVMVLDDRYDGWTFDTIRREADYDQNKREVDRDG